MYVCIFNQFAKIYIRIVIWRGVRVVGFGFELVSFRILLNFDTFPYSRTVHLLLPRALQKWLLQVVVNSRARTLVST